MSKIRFAVVGCGHIGKRHIAEIIDHPLAELVAVCDIKQENEVGLFGVPFFNQLTELLNSGISFDVINICTPNGVHASQTIQALNNSHVLVEKPMALSVHDAEDMIIAEKESGHQLFCVMQNRYSPTAIWLKSILEQNLLGKVFIIHLSCFWNRDERYYQSAAWRGTLALDGGTLFTQFSHFIDILFHLFGDLQLLGAELFKFNHQHLTEFEDSGWLHFSTANGAKGNMQFSTSVYDKNLESSLTIIGEKGTVKVGGQYMEKLEYCHIQNYTNPNLQPSQGQHDYGLYQGSANNHFLVIENVIETIKGTQTRNASPEQCKKVIDFIEQVYKYRII